MTPTKLIWKELWQRPTAMVTCLLAITLGVTALVAIRSITIFSEQAVGEQLEKLGANVLLLPQNSSLENYYAADLQTATLPEEDAGRLALANLEGVENISPKLTVPTELNGRKITLTGILPQSEFQTQASWSGLQLLGKKHEGCKKRVQLGNDNRPASECLAKGRFVRDIAADEAFVGADVALLANLKAGDKVTLLDKEFKVSAIMPATGSVDDSRIFAHLHTVQSIAKSGEVVNAIEIMACCEDAAGGLVAKLGKLFPDAKVVTISQVVQTQVSINRLMGRLSLLFLVILIVVGVASIAGAMFANVTERRREIGTLMALGATPRLLSRLFLGKALVIGLAGGLLGYVIGTVLAVGLGPQWAGVPVQPVASLAGLSIIVAAAVALVASYLPARRASQLDPCVCFREV
jgi:putative ABC transport system permease protein